MKTQETAQKLEEQLQKFKNLERQFSSIEGFLSTVETSAKKELLLKVTITNEEGIDSNMCWFDNTRDQAMFLDTLKCIKKMYQKKIEKFTFFS